MALITPLLYSNNLSESLLLESTLPLIPSITVLVNTLTANEELAMLPWIDVANHRSKSRLFLQYGLLQDNIVLKRDFSSPEQHAADGSYSFVNFDYGGTFDGCSNDKLLGEYGFVEIDNPNDTIEMTVNGEKFVIGRQGIIIEDIFNASIDEVKGAAKSLRNSLANDVLIDSTPDQISTLRINLAKQWRNEKIKLLDEFLA